MSLYHADLTIELMDFAFKHSDSEKEYTVNEIYELIFPFSQDKTVRKNAKERIRKQLKVMELRGLLTVRETLTKRRTTEFKYTFKNQYDGREKRKEA